MLSSDIRAVSGRLRGSQSGESVSQLNAMNTEHQLGGAEGEGGDGEDVEVIVLDDHQYREVFDTSLEVDMENISLQDHDYSKGERSKEVREGEKRISINNDVISPSK